MVVREEHLFLLAGKVRFRFLGREGRLMLVEACLFPQVEGGLSHLLTREGEEVQYRLLQVEAGQL
jgi:hypothetical protein